MATLIACAPSREADSPPATVDKLLVNNGEAGAGVVNDGPASYSAATSDGAFSSSNRSVNQGQPSEQGSSLALFSARFEALSTASDGSRREGPLFRGATLRSGDWLWVNIDVMRRAHIYVVQLDRDGKPELLFPSVLERDEAREAGASFRVPPLPDMFVLDENVGTEHLVVIASIEPVAVSDVQLGLALEAAQAGSNATLTSAHVTPAKPAGVAAGTGRARESTPRSQPSSPPDGYLSRVADRGIVRVNPQAAIEACEDASGVAIVRFTFEHR